MNAFAHPTGSVPTPMPGGQRQTHQRLDWSIGAQHRLGQLQQRIRAPGQALVEPAANCDNRSVASARAWSSRLFITAFVGIRLLLVKRHDPAKAVFTPKPQPTG
jgi:hypothetical protein